jgi:multidrug efflux pump subunit AcrB
MKESPVSKLGLLFINNFRVTILSFAVILLGGFLAYTTFLPRKGFPALEFPIVLVQTSYEVGDVEKVNNDITEPIEFALSNLEGVNTVQTTTTPGFNLAIVSFETGYSSTEQAKEIQNIFKEGIGLPANITPVVSPIVSGTFDGENELVLGLVGDNGQTVADLEAKAEVIAESLNDLSQVKKASVIKQINDVYEPRTGKTHSEQTAFNRYGVKENEKVNFKQSVLIGIKNNNSYTITEISDAIHKKVEDLEDAGELEGFEVVSVYDQAEDLNEQINSLEINAIAAILGVIAVCLLFVHWRAALITAIFIPGVMAGTFVVMLLGGMSLNVISLFGLILVLGLLVDDAIVVVEAIVLAKQEGLKGKKAIVKAINSVGKSDVVGTLTVILVFFPMLFIVGILGEIVKDIPITIIITLSVSLVLALTVIPYFCYKFIVDEDKNAKKNIVSRVLEYPNDLVQLASKYVARFVNFYLSKWYLTALMIVISIVLIFSGLFFASISKVANFQMEFKLLSITPQLQHLQKESKLPRTSRLVLSKTMAMLWRKSPIHLLV